MIATDFKERPMALEGWWKLHALQTGAITQVRLPIIWTPYEKGLNLGFSGLEAGLYNTCSSRSGWVLRSRCGRGTWNDRTRPVDSPLGYPGDRLWVQEPHSFLGHSHEYEDVEYQDGAVKSMKTDEIVPHGKGVLPAWKMPRWAARTLLEVTDVRVDSLRCLTDADIKAMGYVHFEVTAALAALSRRARPRPQHWLHGEGQDEGISWCLSCAKKKVRKLEKEGKAVSIEGGPNDIQDEDGPRFCEGCGHIVEYHLTDYGVETYFPEYEKDPTLTSPQVAYEASRLFESDEKHYPEIAERLRRLGFRYLWDATHAKKGFSWEKNPWTWIVQFRVLSHLS